MKVMIIILCVLAGVALVARLIARLVFMTMPGKGARRCGNCVSWERNSLDPAVKCGYCIVRQGVMDQDERCIACKVRRECREKGRR